MLTYSKLGIDRKCLHLASASTSCQFLGYKTFGTIKIFEVPNLAHWLMHEQLKCKIQNVRVQQHNLCVSTCGTFFETYKIKLSFILTPPVQRDRDADTVEKWSRFRSWLWSTGKKIWSLFLLLPSLLFKGSHSSLGNLSIQLFYALYMCHPFKLLEEDRDFNETKGIFFQVEVWGYGLPNVKSNIFCSKKPNSQLF